MKHLRQYIRQILVNEASCGAPEPHVPSANTQILIPPPPDKEYQIQELEAIKAQRENQLTPKELHEELDFITNVFNHVILEAGYPCAYDLIEQIAEDLQPIIYEHKEHFNTARPYQLARAIGMEFDFDDYESARTPSYPSGHTAQAFYTAHTLSEMYPELRANLFEVAQMIADSRIDFGVHFPSDNKSKKMLADALITAGF